MKNIYMLFAGWEVRIVKNCDRGLSTVFHYTDRPKPVNNLMGRPPSRFEIQKI